MGNILPQCPQRAEVRDEKYFRQKFAQEKLEKERLEEQKRQESELKRQQHLSELAANQAALNEAVGKVLQDNPSLSAKMLKTMLTDTETRNALCELIQSEIEPGENNLKDEIGRLEELVMKKFEAMGHTLEGVQESQRLFEEELVEVFAKKEDMEKAFEQVMKESKSFERELQMTKLDISDRFNKLEESVGEVRLEISAVRDEAMEGHGETKLVVTNLEVSVREVMSKVDELTSRLEWLGQEVGELLQANEDELVCDPVPTTAETNVEANASPAPATKDDSTGRSRPADSDDESVSSDDEDLHKIPRTTGNAGCNAVDVIDWEKLRGVEKKKRSAMTKFDDVIMRTLTDPPIRNDLSWRRWKETVFLWARALRRVRASFHQMGSTLLNKSFAGHEGEYNMAIASSSDRDLVVMMKHLDLKFSIPIRSIMEKAEEIIPSIKRLDGQSPLLFLQLLHLVFLREGEIGGQRGEHSKVTRALAALRLGENATQLIRSRLPVNVSEMSFNGLESIVDQLNITDVKRYDAAGKELEPNRRGEKDLLMEMLVSMGERLQADGGMHHTNLNNFFRPGGAAGTVHFTGAGGPGPADPAAGAGGQIFNTPGGAPSGGPAAYGNGGGKTLEQKDAEYWSKANSVPEADRDKRLKQRMVNLKLLRNEEGYWCPFGDYCQKISTTGKCTGQHTKKEYGPMIRKFQKDFPAKYKIWDEQQKKEKEEKAKAEKEAKAKASAAPK
eukprot:g19431.t1